MVKKTTDHQHAVFEEQLRGAVKVDYNALIDAVEKRIQDVKELLRMNARQGKTSKSGKEFMDEVSLELDALYRQANEWAQNAFPEDYKDAGYISHNNVFNNYEFTVLVSKK